MKTLEENRAILNKHRATTGASKISFTHLIAWAILRALVTFPRLNDAYAELDGQPHGIQRDSVRLGLAVDVQKKDGSRTLLVPNLKDAQALDFAAFLAAYDELVARTPQGRHHARRLHGHHRSRSPTPARSAPALPRRA